MKLTQKVVDDLSLPPGKTETFTWDDDVPGLGVRLQGKRGVWVVQSRVAGGRQQRVTLGPVAGISLKDARRRAGKVLADAKDGKSASGQRREARQRAETSVGDVLDLYVKRYAEANQRPKTLAGTKRYLETAWKPLRALPAVALARRDVATRLAEIAVESGPIAGNRALTALSGALAWAMRQGMVESNPCVAVDKPGAEVKRDRTLAENEVVLLWRATGDGSDYSRIVRLLLLTGQRRDEVGAVPWSELNLDKALWTLPGARAKNGKAHEVPLSRQALSVIGTKPTAEDGDESKAERIYVFGRRAGPFSGFGKSKVELDATLARMRAEARLGRKLTKGEVPAEEDRLPPWQLHDIRHTTVTHMAEIGIAPHIVEACVNHISGHKAGIAGRYNHAAYTPEKRAALQRWADHVERLVSGEDAGNVVTMARREG